MSERVEQLRQSALARVRAGQFDEALSLYDAAYADAEDEETRELITINKADAMIAAERSGPEVQALPKIVMRRRNLRHVYLAAYALTFKFRLENEIDRARFYAQLALQSAEESNETLWKILALNELGSIHDMDSKFAEAIECGTRAIALIEQLENRSEHVLTYAISLENLGASKLLNNEFEEGIALVEQSLPLSNSPLLRVEAYIDLCFGYLAIENLDRARHFGEAGLELANEPRHLRNLYYLLGEVAYKLGEIERAEEYFDKLAKFYPNFRNLKSLLFAIDLRSMVNLKL